MLKYISQTAGFLSTSEISSDRENSPPVISIAHRLPKPNPILQNTDEYEFNSIFKKNNLGQSSSRKMKRSLPLGQLSDLAKKYKLIYQKYTPSQEYYASYFNQTQEVISVNGDVQFDSQFDSGNLMQAFKGKDQYYLILQNDINTKGYSQWFYFTVKSTKIQSVSINIVNINKNMELYQQGQRICVNENYWHKQDLGVQFQKNQISRGNGKYYYTLSFTYKFKESGCVQFAANFPYSYSTMRLWLKSQKLQQQIIERTSLKNECPMINIGTGREYIIILARQHPGETASSFIVEGLVANITQSLQARYEFVIFPMVNVDGVIHGNQRCTMDGLDPNRRWNLKNKIKDHLLMLQKPVALILDLHSHSKRLNAFFYANRPTDFIQKVCERDYRFSLEQCRFSHTIQSSARYQLQQLFPFAQVLTLEVSYHGYQSDGKIVEFTPSELRSMGNTFCQVLEIAQLDKELDAISDVMSASDSNPSEDEIKIVQQERPIPLVTPSIKSRAQSVHQKRLNNTLQLKVVRPKSQMRPPLYNFIEGQSLQISTTKALKNINDNLIFEPMQEIKPSNYKITKIQLYPYHSLKQQFLNQALKQKYKRKCLVIQ